MGHKSAVHWLVAVVVVLGVLGCTAAAADQELYDYLCLVDAGSTGSRIYVYRWDRRTNAYQLPQLQQQKRASPTLVLNELVASDKVSPGLATFITNLTAIRSYLDPLVQWAKAKVPAADLSRTPLALFATAGMRLLDLTSQEKVLQYTRAALKESPFLIEDSLVKVIPGTDEGLYGWLATNYLMGTLPPNKVHGFLDLGGASTQVTFVPPAIDQIPPEKLETLQVTSQFSYAVYSYSYLGYGQDQTLGSLLTLASQQSPPITPVAFPCYPAGYTDASYSGTGDVAACRALVRQFLNLTGTDAQNSAINGVWMPQVQDTDFYAVSGFFYTADFLGLSTGFTPDSMAAVGGKFCQRNWTDIQASYPGVSPAFLKTYCTTSQYIAAMLKDAYHINGTTLVHTGLKINGITVSWALGAAIYEASLPRFVHSTWSSQSVDSFSGSRHPTHGNYIFWIILGCCAFLVLVLGSALIFGLSRRKRAHYRQLTSQKPP